MMDIVHKLRTESPTYLLIGDAAIEIEKLREERNQLRKVLLDVLAKEYVADCKDVARSAPQQKESE